MWISFLILIPSLKTVGDYFFTHGEYKKAVEIYNRAYREKPSPELKLKIGLSLYRLGITALKKDNFNEALSQFKLGGNKYGIGFVNYKVGNKENAKKVFHDLNDFYALGVISYQENEFKEALQYFKLANSPYGMGISFYRLGAYKEALDYFKKANDNFLAAECCYKLKKFNEAESYYQKALQETNWTRDALYGLAWTHYKLGKFSLSAQEFKKFITQYPKDPLIPISLYYTARTLLKIGDLQSAIKHFKTLINEYPGSEFIDDSYYWMGKAYFIQSDYTACIKQLNFLLSNYPNSNLRSYAYLLIGDVYYKQNDYNSAINWYKKVKGPSDILDDARFKLEKCYFGLGEYSSSLDILHNFIHKYPKSPRSPKFGLELAQYWVKQNNFQKAIESYNNVIYNFSWSSLVDEAKLGLADCYFRIGKYDAAIETYRELFNTSLGMKAQFSLANTYFLLAEYDRAIHEYEILINEFQNSDFAKDAQYQIGLSYERLEKPREARLAFQKFIEKYQKDPNYWDAELKLSKTYRDEGLIDEYLEALLHVEAKGEGKPKQEATFLLGSLYFDKEDYKTAKEFYLKAASQYEDIDSKSKSFIYAARCAVALGKKDEAIELYKAVLSLLPNPALEEEAKKGIKQLGE